MYNTIDNYILKVDSMYLKRKIDLFLMNWKNSENRKPLIVKGPRQIGKTESIRKFAIDNYKSVKPAGHLCLVKYNETFLTLCRVKTR